jgi:hypothetical protein
MLHKPGTEKWKCKDRSFPLASDAATGPELSHRLCSSFGGPSAGSQALSAAGGFDPTLMP